MKSKNYQPIIKWIRRSAIAALTMLAGGLPQKASAQEESVSNKPICFLCAATQNEGGSPVYDMGIQATGAHDFFYDNFCGDNGIGFIAPSYLLSKLDPNVNKCVWIHVDRQQIENGWRHLPEAFSNPKFLDDLHTYMLKGGNIYLSGQAVELLSPIWRIVPGMKANHWEHNNEYKHEDGTWGIASLYKDKENHLHPIFNGLTQLGDADNQFGILAGNSFVRDNHNTIWDLTTLSYKYGSEAQEGFGLNLTNLQRFEKDNLATVLASFNWDTEGNTHNYAGIVEYHPVFSWDYENGGYVVPSGSIIANGVAALQWRYFPNTDFLTNPDCEDLESSANGCRDNLEKLTSNILNYLAGEDRIIKWDEEPYARPDHGLVEEIVESTGLVAMYIGYDDENDPNFIANKQEYAAYTFFKNNFIENPTFQNRYSNGRGPQILWKKDKDKIKFCGQESEAEDAEGFEAVWVNIAGTRAKEVATDDNGEPLDGDYTIDANDLKQLFTEDGYNQLISQLKQFRKDGGNIYLTKFANILVKEIDGDLMSPNQITADNKTESDPWGININYGGYNQESHPIYSTMPITIRDHGHGVTLFEGTGTRLDTNCVWWLANEKFPNGTNTIDWNALGNEDRLRKFNEVNNATVLGVWGHNEGYAFYTAGLVEFHPKRGQSVDNGPEKMTPRPLVEERRGTIMANGVGAYEWDTDENDVVDDANVRKLTNNILAYLTPVMSAPTYTGLSLPSSDEATAITGKPTYYNLQGVPVENPSNGIFIEVCGGKSRKIKF